MSSKKTRTLITLGLVVVAFILFSVTTDTFFNLSNFSNLLRDAAYIGTVAIGMSVVMISGNIDLSAGGVICLSGCVGARLAVAGAPAFIVVISIILTGIALGYLNSVMINHLHLTPFVATLAAGFVYSGLGLLSAFRDDYGRLTNVMIMNRSFTSLSNRVGIFYFSVIAWIILTVVVYFVQSRTKFGLHTYAMGSHESAAQMSGVKLIRSKAMCYMICGALCGVAAVFTVAYNQTATPALGSTMEFQAIAACVVGGVVMSGGSGNSIGAALGALFMAMLTNGMLKYGMNTDWQQIFQGAVIILAIGFDAIFTRVTTARLRAQNE